MEYVTVMVVLLCGTLHYEPGGMIPHDPGSQARNRLPFGTGRVRESRPKERNCDYHPTEDKRRTERSYMREAESLRRNPKGCISGIRKGWAKRNEERGKREFL